MVMRNWPSSSLAIRNGATGVLDMLASRGWAGLSVGAGGDVRGGREKGRPGSDPGATLDEIRVRSAMSGGQVAGASAPATHSGDSQPDEIFRRPRNRAQA